MVLESDACFGDGAGALGIVDATIKSDAYGLPIIGRETLRGLLKEESERLLFMDVATSSTTVETAEGLLNTLYGITGSADGGMLKLGNGRPVGADKLMGAIRAIEESVYVNLFRAYSSPTTITSLFTHIKHATALENHVAKTDTLRNIQVVSRGTVFCFDGHLLMEGSSDAMRLLLESSVKALRHGGMLRNRGLGALKCFIDWHDCTNTNTNTNTNDDDEDKDTSDIEIPGGQVEKYHKIIYYKLTLLSSCVIERDPDYIPGAMLLGAAAGAYLRTPTGIAIKTAAHNNQEFKKMFLCDNPEEGLCFSNAYPLADDEPGMPLPLALKVKKYSGERVSPLYNLLHPDIAAVMARDNAPDYQDTPFAFAAWRSRGIPCIAIEVKHTVNMHVRRPSDRSRGRKVTGDDGGLRTESALREGQSFWGTIEGPAYLVEKALACLGGEVRLGKRLAPAKLERTYALDTNLPGNCAGKTSEPVELLLLSDLIMLDKYGMPSVNLDDFRDLLQAHLHAKKALDAAASLTIVTECCCVAVGEVAGFNSQWRMARDVQLCLKMGSVISVQTVAVIGVSPPTIDTGKLDNIRLGERTSCGLGHLCTLQLNKKFCSVSTLAIARTPSSATREDLATQLLDALDSVTQENARRPDPFESKVVQEIRRYVFALDYSGATKGEGTEAYLQALHGELTGGARAQASKLYTMVTESEFSVWDGLLEELCKDGLRKDTYCNLKSKLLTCGRNSFAAQAAWCLSEDWFGLRRGKASEAERANPVLSAWFQRAAGKPEVQQRLYRELLAALCKKAHLDTRKGGLTP
jgi:hypothetical protein